MVLRQTAKMTSEFVFFSSNPSLNHIKIEKCLLLFATNTNIFTLLFKELKTDGKSSFCRLPFDVKPRRSSLISLMAVINWLSSSLSGRRSGTNTVTVVNVATVDFRFWGRWIDWKIGVQCSLRDWRSWVPFGTHGHTIDLFTITVGEWKTV